MAETPSGQGCGKALSPDMCKTVLFAAVVSAVLLGLNSTSLPSSPSPSPPLRKTMWEGEAFPSALLALCPSTNGYLLETKFFLPMLHRKSLNSFWIHTVRTLIPRKQINKKQMTPVFSAPGC